MLTLLVASASWHPTTVTTGPQLRLRMNEAAKAAWLARLDAPPSWLTVDWSHKDDEAAKAAWLAKLDAPTWGAVATIVATSPKRRRQGPGSPPGRPSWRRTADTLQSVAESAATETELRAECEEVARACDDLSVEEAAKAAWLAKVDAPTWGRCSRQCDARSRITSAGGQDGAPFVGRVHTPRSSPLKDDRLENARYAYAIDGARWKSGESFSARDAFGSVARVAQRSSVNWLIVNDTDIPTRMTTGPEADLRRRREHRIKALEAEK